MVDIASLPRAAALAEETRTISQALNYFDHHGRIVAMTVSGPPVEGSPGVVRTSAPPVTIDTSYMEAPPQMVQVVTQLLAQRLEAVRGELGELGVTGPS